MATNNTQVPTQTGSIHENNKLDRDLDSEKHGNELHRLRSNEIYAAAASHGYKQISGRLVIDPKEAEIEFGPEIASKLKLSKDGTKGKPFCLD